jgi:hypothetical protein
LVKDEKAKTKHKMAWWANTWKRMRENFHQFYVTAIYGPYYTYDFRQKPDIEFNHTSSHIIMLTSKIPLPSDMKSISNVTVSGQRINGSTAFIYEFFVYSHGHPTFELNTMIIDHVIIIVTEQKGIVPTGKIRAMDSDKLKEFNLFEFEYGDIHEWASKTIESIHSQYKTKLSC